MKFVRRLASLVTARRLIAFVVALVLVFVLSLAVVGLYTHKSPLPSKLEREAQNTKNNVVADVTELYPIKVVGIVVPHTLDDIVREVESNQHVSIGGGRNSMGGQTASNRAVQLDMREYNRVLSLSTTTKEITVQAGIRWYDVQKYIDPYNLSVKIMQTYSNFTVGGSLSVNVHGRYIGLGPIILSVKSFRIVLADGSVVQASPTEHSDIFYSAIGGLGGIGVISDVTLELADNVNVERSRVLLSTDQYADFFSTNIRTNENVIFHNGDMYPPDFDHISAVSWDVTDKQPSVPDRLNTKSRDYWLERTAWMVMSDWPYGRWIREHIFEPLIYSGTSPVHTRNYEASYDIAELEPESRSASTYVLQEYFVPVENFDAWVPKMKKVFNDNNVNVINVSIRYAKKDPGSLLAWAKKESFAFVVYYKQGTDDASKQAVKRWTREMIDQVLTVGGTYYLPYQPQATDDQFHRAYPGAVDYFATKQHYDPTDKFTNNLWDTYYSPQKLDYYKQRQKELSVASTTSEYFRPFDNAYLSLPEWYIVYSAEEYARVLHDSLPSHFNYSQANFDYWSQYNTVTGLTTSSTHNNSDYILVLNIIGVSFSLENVVKEVYENTVGRVCEWLAGNTQVPEDVYAGHVAQAYATFIYDYPWYDFPYATYFKDLWSVHADRKYSFGQNIRRGERRVFLSLEYGAKSVYAALIRAATHAKFGVQDDIVYAIATSDGGASYYLLSAPHYQPFTRALVERMAAEKGNDKFSVVDISGNTAITLSYVDAVGAQVPQGATEVVRDSEIKSITQDGIVRVDRVTVLVEVKDLFSVYKALDARGVAIDHLYDY
jgi:FAD/FMN-containing dehydrogenase